MIYIIGGGTVSHVRNHIALCAPAYGETAFSLYDLVRLHNQPATLRLTRMAERASTIETNDDVAKWLDSVIADPAAKILFFNVAMVDFDGEVGRVPSGKHATRLKTKDGIQVMVLEPSEKLIGRARKTRKDLFVVGFKTTTGATPDEQYLAALDLLKSSSI